MPKVQCVDFIPQMLEAEVPYSTLSLIGSRGGPKYESFSVVVENANRWLENHRGACVVHVEVLDVSGVYSCDGFQTDRPEKVSAKDSISVATAAFLKIIRLWYTNADGDTTMSRLTFSHVVPARLETNPRAFKSKVSDPSRIVESFQQSPQAGDINVEGQLLSVQSSMFRFNSRHCSLDPDRCFWMVDDVSEVHICFYFTVFFVKPVGCSSSRLADQEIYYEDFASKVALKSHKSRKKSVYSLENVSVLMERIRLWLANSDARLVTIQTIDHSAYYQCSIDSPGYEDKSLANPHYRSSLSSLQRCSKVLRVYYCKRVSTNGCISVNAKSRQIAHKSFVMRCKPVPLSRVNLGQLNADIHIQLESRVMQDVNDTLENTDAPMVAIETLKLGVDNKCCKCSSADETQFISKSTVDSGAVYGVRLYVSQSEQSGSNNVESKSVPSIIGNLCNSQCILS